MLQLASAGCCGYGSQIAKCMGWLARAVVGSTTDINVLSGSGLACVHWLSVCKPRGTGFMYADELKSNHRSDVSHNWSFCCTTGVVLYVLVHDSADARNILSGVEIRSN